MVIIEYKFRIVHPGHGINQAQAKTAAVLRATLIHAIESLQHLAVLLDGNTGSTIGYRQHRMEVPFAELKLDATGIR
jgi:hypothetical protein